MHGASVLTSYFLCIVLIFAEDLSLSNHIDGNAISKVKKINPLDYTHPVGRNEGVFKPLYEELKDKGIEKINSVDFKRPIGKKNSQKGEVRTALSKTEYKGDKAGLPGNLSLKPFKLRNEGLDVPSTSEVGKTYDPPISDLTRRKLGLNVLGINSKPRRNKQNGRRSRKNRRRGLLGIKRKLHRRLRRKKLQSRAKNIRRKNKWRTGRKLKRKHGHLSRKHVELKRKHRRLRRKHRKLQQRLRNLDSKNKDPKINNPIL
ncbi:uncharacterized protein LOC125651555 [Ostrea edulis]|uniref:uncharacterized protein LOC125651555 n=1 Tax=Ostrea edulis TaxID=37623 RepID=UPI0024AF15AD|nr:uncharacterized protein LOC125651555 [Ostrea edulis]